MTLVNIYKRHKAPTTTNPSSGISDALTSMFEQAEINPSDVASVTIGTTVCTSLRIRPIAAHLEISISSMQWLREMRQDSPEWL
jgi:hypothetical protein